MRSPTPAARRGALAIAGLLSALLSGGCSHFRAKDAERTALDAYEFQKPLSEVWPDALRLVAEADYPLNGKDRQVVGLDEQGAITKFFAKGHETQLRDGNWVAESGYGRDRRRYRVIGTETGPKTSKVSYVSLKARDDIATEEEARDVEMQLALVRRLDPAAADRIEAAATAAR